MQGSAFSSSLVFSHVFSSGLMYFNSFLVIRIIVDIRLWAVERPQVSEKTFCTSVTEIQLCVPTCPDSDWYLFLLHDWAPPSRFQSILLSRPHKAGRIQEVGKLWPARTLCDWKLSCSVSGKKVIKSDSEKDVHLTLAPFTPLQSHFPHDVPQPWKWTF